MVGAMVGREVGVPVGQGVGVPVGPPVGDGVGTCSDDVGEAVGEGVGLVGVAVGEPVGTMVGSVVGFGVGSSVGLGVGAGLGRPVGTAVGEGVLHWQSHPEVKVARSSIPKLLRLSTSVMSDQSLVTLRPRRGRSGPASSTFLSDQRSPVDAVVILDVNEDPDVRSDNGLGSVDADL
jgi:hypothetical protein